MRNVCSNAIKRDYELSTEAPYFLILGFVTMKPFELLLKVFLFNGHLIWLELKTPGSKSSAKQRLEPLQPC